jgi:acyl carrier protein
VSLRERIVAYVRSACDPEFDADRHELAPLLDSVALLQLIAFIDGELGVNLDLASLRIDMFATVESVVRTIEDVRASDGDNGLHFDDSAE